MDRIVQWFKQHLSNPQVVNLTIVLLGVLLIVSFAGGMLAPVIAGLVLAYLLEGLIGRLTQIKVPRILSVWLVFLVFVIFLASIIFGLLPILYNQMTEVVQQIPSMLTKGQAALMTLPEHYPELFSIAQVEEIIASLRTQLTAFGQGLVTSSISGAASVVTVVIYVVLLPILIFFFLKDKTTLLKWLKRFLPRENELAIRVWGDVDLQIGNYIRGKFWEILIVWFVTFATFSYLGMQYSMLLSVLVGVSVLIPYVGAAIVTIPVVIIAWFQWGWNSDFITLVIAYLVIQTLDGNLLVPLLFSEVVNIHPVAIIVAVLVFGGLWGIWGVFFAIPLATLVQAILFAWPKSPGEDRA
ncbi:AI-2E family transporter [Candidatus Spongiihabitans sp.]|uniref:AI-2E family transporter n=1 Tax=Candidatus Spongiihabitans sp. TaxID=3101308 RepID=UPI003C7A9AE2